MSKPYDTLEEAMAGVRDYLHRLSIGQIAKENEND